MLSMSAVGGPQRVAQRLAQMVAETEADELIVACAVHDHAARLRSCEIVAGLTLPAAERATA